MAILGRPALLALVVLAAGCEFTREPTPLELTEETVAAHSLLRAGSDTVAVWLRRPDPNDLGFQPISGARVRLTGPEGSIELVEAAPGFRRCGAVYFPGPGSGVDTAGPGCYAARFPGGIRSGVPYELLIVLPGGDTVRGATVVPEAPVVLAPEDNVHLQVGDWFFGSPAELEVRWRLDSLAASGWPAPALIAKAVFEDGAARPDATCSIGAAPDGRPTGTAEVRVRLEILGVSCLRRPGEGPGTAVDWDSIQALLRVPACDTACVRYQNEVAYESYVRADRASAGLTGAYGLFGGVALAERTVVLVRQR